MNDLIPTQRPSGDASLDHKSDRPFGTSDAITVLGCIGDHIASKRYTRQGDEWVKTDFDLGFRFRPARCEIADLHDLADLIEEIRSYNTAVVVRGELTSDVMAAVQRDPAYTIARRKNDHGDGIPPSLTEIERRWLMVDIDAYPLPADADLIGDPVAVIDTAIRALLPAQFHDAKCFYQLSNSCGFAVGVLKVHLFFWLSEPARNDHLRAVFRQFAPYVDTAPFNATQPHFLADPVIEGGPDPVPQRTGWRHGPVAQVTLPQLIAASKTTSGFLTTGTGLIERRVRSIGDALSRLGDGDGGDGFHAPLLAGSMQYAIRCARGADRDDAAFIAKLQGDIEAAPRRGDRTDVKRYLDFTYLARIINGAFGLVAVSNKKDEKDKDEDVATVELPAGFGLTPTGLWFTDPDRQDAKAVWVSARFTIVGQCEDGVGGGWGLVLRWFDEANRKHEMIVPRGMLHREPNAIAGLLDENGLRCGTSRAAHQSLRHFLAVMRPEKRLHAVERAGWSGTTYVLPDGMVYGHDDIMLRPEWISRDAASGHRGTHEEWRQEVGRLAVGNSRLMVFLSAAFAGTLLDIIGEPSGGLHLVGKSQTGKSTAAFVAGSVWGKGDRDGAVRQWRTSVNGLEGVAARCNDGALILDELSQMDARQAGEAIYQLANGAGKVRMKDTTALRQTAKWRLMFLSTGEVTLAQRMSEAGKRTLSGMEVRFVNLIADAGAGMGVFQCIHDSADAGTFADRLRDAARTTYGTAGRVFVERLADERTRDPDGLRDALKGLRERFIINYLPADADGQVRSVAGRFGVIAAAGEIAAVWGVLPWNEDAATKAAAECFSSWLVERGGAGAGEDQITIAQVRSFIEQHGTSRFAEIRQVDACATEELRDGHTYNRCGWRRYDEHGGRWDYLVMPEAWKVEVCKGIDASRAAKLLADRGWLKRDGRHFTCKETIPENGRVRVYVLSGAILEAD